MIFIINKNNPDNMYEIVIYFFNLFFFLILFLGITNIKKDGPLNRIENTNEDVNIFL